MGVNQVKALLTALLCLYFLGIYAQNPGDLFVRGSMTLQENAELYIRGDIKMLTDDAFIRHSGKIELEGNLLKVEDANLTTFSGSQIIFRNDDYNVDSFQYILGDFDDALIFSHLEIDNRAPEPLFMFLGQELTILDELVMTRGEISATIPTGVFVPAFDGVDIEDYPEGNIVLVNAAANALTVNLDDSFISSRFERKVTDTGVYIFPVGSSEPSTYGPQTLYILGSGGAQFNLSVEFDPDVVWNTDALQALCDIGTVPFDFTTPDGLLDTLNLACIAGGWTLATNSTTPYSALASPNINLINQCNIGYNYLLVDGIPVSDCPTNLFQTTPLTGNTQLTIAGVGDIQDIYLPVELTGFQLNNLERAFDLVWETAAEINFNGFELQRSLNGVDFSPIAWISGKGSPDFPADYSFIDENVLSDQTYYYRLKMVDTDELFSYSEILTGKLNRQTSGSLTIFPNPVSKSEMVIRFESVQEGLMTFELFNQLGQLVWRKSEIISSPGVTSLQLPQKLATGSYIARLKLGEDFLQTPLLISY